MKPFPPSTLERGRVVYLRAPTRRDRAAFVELIESSRALHRPWMDDLDDRYFDRYFERRVPLDRFGLLAIRRKDGALAGVVNVSAIQRGLFQSAYLSYFAHARHAGEGRMTEALSLAVRHAFRTHRLHRLEANIRPENERSIALVKRCGFRLEGYSPRYLKIRGRWRDHERWAITVEDWRGRPK